MAISRQNKRSTSRRSEGFPGDFIGALPVNAFIQPAGLPINTSTIEVLRRPVEFTNYTSAEFATTLTDLGVRQSVGRTGICYDNAMAESFFAALKNERVSRTVYPTRERARADIARYIEFRYNTKRLHSALGYKTPLEVYAEYLNRPSAA